MSLSRERGLTMGEHHGGKGDRYRSVDQERYALNYDLCFGTPKERAAAKVRLMELDAIKAKEQDNG